MTQYKLLLSPERFYKRTNSALKRTLLSPQLPFLATVIGGFGMRPNFLIIGTQKGGTTSLYHYLGNHSCILPAKLKEVHYFSFNFTCGERWYRAHFPNAGKAKKGALTYEASPYYLFLPSVPKRVASFNSQMKLIAMLREPVSRAYSHYQMSVKQGHEALSFEKAIEQESKRLERERDLYGSERAFTKGTSHRAHSYLKRGYYAEQLERWFEHFPREQLLILKSEDFFSNPAGVHQEVLQFLGVPVELLPSYPQYNAGKKQLPISETLKHELEAHFAPHNARLEALLGRPFYGQSEVLG